MPVTTHGHLGLSPLQLHVNRPLSLEDIVTRMNSRRFPGTLKSDGFGGVHDPVEGLGDRIHQRAPARPAALVQETTTHPTHIEARYYWPRVEPRLRRFLGREAGDALLIQDAVDLWVTQAEGERPGAAFGVLISGSEPGIVGAVRNALSSLEVPGESWVTQLGHGRHEADDDFFLWLVERYNNNQQLLSDLSLTDLRSIRHTDRSARQMGMRDSAGFDRLALRAAISEKGSVFGPAKIQVYDDDLHLNVDFEWRKDGGCTITLRDSFYDGDEDDDLPRELLGPRLVNDVVYVVMPKVQEAYRADADWPRRRRAAFVAHARATLRAELR